MKIDPALITAIAALLMAGGAIVGQWLAYRAKIETEANKPAVDQSTVAVNEATAAETIGEAWDRLYNKSQERIDALETTVSEQAELIRRQGETMSALMHSMDKITAENSALKTENAQLRQRIGEQEREIQQLRSELDKLKNQ